MIASENQGGSRLPARQGIAIPYDAGGADSSWGFPLTGRRAAIGDFRSIWGQRPVVAVAPQKRRERAAKREGFVERGVWCPP